MRLWTCLTGCLLILIALCGCGTPGAPQPPSLNLARPVDNLTATRGGNRVQLDWTLGRKNTDRTLVKNIPLVRVCRREGLALMSTCIVVAEVPAPRPQAHPKNGPPPEAVHMQYVDDLPPQLGERNPAGFVTYAVEEMNSHDRSAGLSNQVAVPVAPTIAPPDELSLKLNADGVSVSWTGAPPPAASEGLTYQYQIERRPVGGPAYIGVGNVEPSAQGTYLDKTFEWEKKYEYRILTATQVHSQGLNVTVPGEATRPAEIFTRDMYPPAQPAGLQAVFSSVGQKPFIDLTWAPNMEGDLVGYNVFRRLEGGQSEKLNRQPVQVASFRDENVAPGRKYMYAVSAVDLRGNESPRSVEASEEVPGKQ